MSGFAGDVVTSALWAAGMQSLGRSFKYHRPRGVLSFANHDVNVLLEDAAHISLRGDVTPLVQDMDLAAVNTFGSAGVKGDRAAILDRLSGFLPVGFYYKAFHRPKWLAPKWETFFRFMSGLGKGILSSSLAKLLKDNEFATQFHEGEKANIHIQLVGNRVILVVIFDSRSSLGLVRLRVKKATEELNHIFESLLKKVAEPGADSPFAEITDEDIDNLFND